MPKGDRVELSAFIEIIWKEKDLSEMALPWELGTSVFSPDMLRMAV